MRADTDKLLSKLYNDLHENLTQHKKAGIEHKLAIREAVVLEGVLNTPSTVKTVIKKYLWKLLAIICACLSMYICGSELLIFLEITSYDFLTSSIPDVCLASVFLFYMTIATYYGLFNIRIASYYSLDPH